MAQYKPSKNAEDTEATFDRLEQWPDLKPPEREYGTAIPTEAPAIDEWGRRLPIPFEVPEQPIDLDSIDTMFSTAAQSQGPTQASGPSPAVSKQRSQSRQEGT